MTEERDAEIGADVDVRAIMDEVHAEVRRKREAGAYPPEVVAELESVLGAGDGASAMDRVLVDLHWSASFTPEVTTASEKPYIAPVVSRAKQAIQTSVRWYMTGVLHQINGFSANVLRAFRAQSDRMQALEERAVRAEEEAEALRHEVEGLRNGLDERLARAERAVRRLQQGTGGNGADAPAARGPEPYRPETAPRSWEIERRLDYLAFEERFRGSEEAIKERQRGYGALFAGAGGRVVDLGCGRGEFLEVLQEAGVDCYGVDRHPDMVARCRERGFEVVEDDVLAHLRGVSPGTLGGIFSAHTIEHLDTRDVPLFVDLAAEALGPDGVLVVETPNPESLFVFAHAFYVDLGHLRPLHPLTLHFLALGSGFRDARLEYHSPPPDDVRPQPLSPPGEEHIDRLVEPLNENFRRIDDLLFGGQEYALIARK